MFVSSLAKAKCEERELLLLWPWRVLFSDAVSTTLFSAYPALEVKFLLAVRSLQKWRISQHFSLSLSVIRNRLCLLSFTKPKTEVCCLKFPPSSDGDFCPTYLQRWMCGPLSWQVCLNVSDRSQWKTGRKGKLPAPPPPWLYLYLAWPVDGDVNLLWLHSCLDASPSIPSSLLLLSVAHWGKRGVSPRVEGHATNSWPPLKTMKLLIQDARLVHSAYWLEKSWRAIIMSLECHNLSGCLCEDTLIQWQSVPKKE